MKNDLAFAFLTNIPITPGHTLISPLRCIKTMEELSKRELEDIMNMRTILCAGLKKLYGEEGFNFAWNEGEMAGQSVPHFHLHIVPRKEGDSGIREYEPRKFLYRPGSREKTPESELAKMAEEIKIALDENYG